MNKVLREAVVKVLLTVFYAVPAILAMYVLSVALTFSILYEFARPTSILWLHSSIEVLLCAAAVEIATFSLLWAGGIFRGARRGRQDPTEAHG
jgi:hypothetical protein